MSKIEVIENNREALAKEMVECYHAILKSGGGIRYDIYIWSDGEIEPLQLTSSGNGWLQAKESESRELYFVGTVKIDEFYFDPWDCYPDPKPEDEEEAEKIEEEIIDECVEDFDPDEIIDEAIAQAEYDED